MSTTTSSCAAAEYGKCYGPVEETYINFKYRDFAGHHKPDTTEEVNICKYHSEWLYKENQEEALEMRGENVESAIHESLFAPFADKTNIFTLLKVLIMEKENPEDVNYEVRKQLILVNGHEAETEKFQRIIMAADKNIICVNTEGIFQQTAHHYPNDVVQTAVIEIKAMANDDNALLSLAGKLIFYYKPILTWQSFYDPTLTTSSSYQAEESLDIDMNYTIEYIPQVLISFFANKAVEMTKEYSDFAECVYFIEEEIDPAILNWREIRKKSQLTTEMDLFVEFRRLTKALLEGDEKTITEMARATDSGAKGISPDVLWLTYIIANHELFRSLDEAKCLRNNTRLIELFIEAGLEYILLLLAISGERVRYLGVKRREHYNILCDNETVVQFLVPDVIGADEQFTLSSSIEEEESVSYTPLKYFDEFSNKLMDINPFYESSFWEKNENIKMYLQQCIDDGQRHDDAVGCE
jgi:hypothetical protein